jgi:cytochrome c2
MPASLKFVLILLAGAIMLALGSGIVLHRQTQDQLRVAAEQMTSGDSTAGRAAITRYGCAACHAISGIPAARGAVGPSLSGIAAQSLLAGKLPNSPDNMIRWIRSPQQISPGTGMPNLGVSDRDARDMAAYLYTLQQAVPDK